MKINKAKLLSALETVKPGLASKEMIEQSTYFCFKDGKVVTFNDEISVSHPTEGLEFEGAVSSSELLAFLQKLKNEEIDVEVGENELLFKSGRSKAGLILQHEVTLPIEEIGEIKKWKKLPDDFSAGLNFTMGSCSRDMSRPILTTVHVNKKHMEGSDSYRIANFELTSKVPIKPFLLPANSCMKVIKMVPDEISEGDGWVHFKKFDTVMSCRIFEEEYPDTSIHMVDSGQLIEFPSNLLDILDLAGIFAKRQHMLDERIIISIDGKKMKIKSCSDSGWFEQPSKVEYKGDPIQFEITPYLLKDILSQTTKGKISKNTLIFTGENWKYLTLLQ